MKTALLRAALVLSLLVSFQSLSLMAGTDTITVVNDGLSSPNGCSPQWRLLGWQSSSWFVIYDGGSFNPGSTPAIVTNDNDTSQYFHNTPVGYQATCCYYDSNHTVQTYSSEITTPVYGFDDLLGPPFTNSQDHAFTIYIFPGGVDTNLYTPPPPPYFILGKRR